MSEITLRKRDDATHVVINGSFVFDLNKAFREAYQSLPNHARVVVDLTAADYIDSAGLGMLIRLRDHLGGDSSRITLKGANPTIRQILEVANFSQLFRID